MKKICVNGFLFLVMYNEGEFRIKHYQASIIILKCFLFTSAI